MVDRDVWPDNSKEVGAWVAGVVVLGLTVSTWVSNPGFIFRAEATVSQATGQLSALTEDGSNRGEAEGLVLNSEEVGTMNEVYREQDLEVVYCGVMSGDRIEDVWFANTLSAERDSATFSISNCPSRVGIGDRALIHTQPTSLELSDTDKESSVELGFEYSCIQRGQIPETGDPSSSFKCYSVPDRGVNGDFREVSVSVE